MDILNRRLLLVAVIFVVAGICTTCGAPFAARAGASEDVLKGAIFGSNFLVLVAVGLGMLIAVRWAWNFAKKERGQEN